MNERRIRADGQRIAKGDYLTLDAEHGLLYAGNLDIETRKPEALLRRVQEWREYQAPEPPSLQTAGA